MTGSTGAAMTDASSSAGDVMATTTVVTAATRTRPSVVGPLSVAVCGRSLISGRLW